MASLLPSWPRERMKALSLRVGEKLDEFEQKLQGAQRSASPEKDADEEPHDHRRQPHPGVRQGDQEAPARKAREGQTHPRRDAHDKAQECGHARDLDREPGDTQHPRISR